MKIGSLFSGYGGLDMGVQSILGGDVAWHVEYDDAPSRILAHHWPEVPNYGDITKVKWDALEPVDVMTGGFPCQDLSLAGRRSGMRPGTRSGLWADYLTGINVMRPRVAVIENVRGLLNGCAESEVDRELGLCPRCSDPTSGAKHAPNVRALGRVLIDLARIGYDARWLPIRASDAGAPHERFRVFIVAHPEGEPWGQRDGDDVSTWGDALGRLSAAGRGSIPDSDHAAGDGEWSRAQLGEGSTEASSYATNDGHERARSARHGRSGSSNRRQPPADTERERSERRRAARDVARAAGTGEADSRERQRHGDAPDDRWATAAAWGPFATAIERWANVTGRIAPAPTRPDGRADGERLSPEFVEWMMGLPEGHVTRTDTTRAEQLKALGNGVVPQQAALAMSLLMPASHSSEIGDHRA